MIWQFLINLCIGPIVGLMFLFLVGVPLTMIYLKYLEYRWKQIDERNKAQPKEKDDGYSYWLG